MATSNYRTVMQSSRLHKRRRNNSANALCYFLHKLMAMPISVSQSAPQTSFICHRIHSHCVHYFILIHAAFMCPNEVGYGSICIPLALVFHNSTSAIAFQRSPVDICKMVGRIQQKSSRMGWGGKKHCFAASSNTGEKLRRAF